ncbi:MAG: serine/threonine-protein kinase [Polyangiaceae bacterium]
MGLSESASSDDPSGQLPVPGDLLDGKYRIEGTIGKGGMAVVLAATHEALKHPVAVKILQPQYAASHELQERFFREARALAALHSKHITRVYDVGKLSSGAAFLVLERLEGLDMHDVLQRDGPLHWKRAVRYILEATEGLREAHAHGVLHRDIKPSNMFLANDGAEGCIKLLDFGLAKLKEENVTVLTGAESVMGSPSYMAPEQIKGLINADERSDVWSLGVSLYELLTDGYPFEADNATKIAAAVIMKAPIPLAGRSRPTPPGLEDVIMACLEKARDKRIATTEELIARLTPFLSVSFDETGALKTKRPGKSLHLDTQETWVARPADPTYGGEMPSDAAERQREASDAARTRVNSASERERDAETLLRVSIDDEAPVSRRDRVSLDQMGIATMVKAPRPELAKAAVDYTPRAGEGTLRSPYAEASPMREARDQSWKARSIPADGGYDARWIDHFSGRSRSRLPIPFPFPNTSSRTRAVKARDLHHVLTGYRPTWTGELELSAWEVGAGCADFFLAWQLNLAGVFAGLFFAPRRTFRAFVRGRRSQSLYGREDLELILEKSVAEARSLLGVPSVNPAARLGDVVWFVAAALLGAFAAAAELALALALLPLGLLFAVMGKRSAP